MPRTAMTDQTLQDMNAAPDFHEEPAAPPAEAKDKLAQARKDLAEMKAEKPESTENKPDETVPGGVYIVNGKLVDAWGQPIKDA